MHAENGGAIDVIVSKPSPKESAREYHALTRPTTAEAEATSRAIAWPKWPAARLHRSSLLQ